MLKAHSEFDNIIHAPNRLQICALLSHVSEMEFKPLKSQLGVSDSVLSKQLKVLEGAGYIQASKQTSKTGYKRTWLALTPLGKKAYFGHVMALQAVIGR